MFKHIVWPWLSLVFGMFFAAGDMAIAGGDGGTADVISGGNDGADTDGGDSAADGTDGQAVLDADADADSGAIANADAQTQGDGRTIPAEVKKLLADLKTTNPKLAATLKGQLFENQAWKQAFPGGLKEARAIKTTLDNYGGAEAIAELQNGHAAITQQLEEIDAKVAAGDPEYIASIFKQFPEGASKMMPSALENFRAADPDGYNFTMGRVVYNTAAAGLIPAAKALQTALQAKNDAGVNQAFGEIVDWINGIQALASKQPQKTVDPERQKLDADRQQFETERREAFKADVGANIKTHMETAIESELGKHLKLRGIDIKVLRKNDPDAFESLFTDVDRRIASGIKADKKFLDAKDALMSSGNKAQVLKHYRAKIDSLIVDAAKKTDKVFYSAGGGKQQNNAARVGANNARKDLSGGGSPGPQLGARPEQGTIDWQRVPAGYKTVESAILDGKAYVKGRKDLVNWR